MVSEMGRMIIFSLRGPPLNKLEPFIAQEQDPTNNNPPPDGEICQVFAPGFWIYLEKGVFGLNLMEKELDEDVCVLVRGLPS